MGSSFSGRKDFFLGMSVCALYRGEIRVLVWTVATPEKARYVSDFRLVAPELVERYPVAFT